MTNNFTAELKGSSKETLLPDITLAAQNYKPNK